MTPNRIWIQVARPGEQYPNGKEGWYRLEGETLLLTTKAGEPIAKRKLAAGENVELVAKRLLLRQSRPKNVEPVATSSAVGIFHRDHCIPVRRGRSRQEVKPFYIRFCRTRSLNRICVMASPGPSIRRLK
jgi:hypothetical protein